MDCRRCYTKFIKQYKSRTETLERSSIPGTGRVLHPQSGFLKRILWFGALLASTFCGTQLLLASLDLYSHQATTTSADTNYLHWITPFPTVTVCEELDNEKLDIFLRRKNVSKSLAQFYREVSFLSPKMCPSCMKCEIGKSCLQDVAAAVNEFRSQCEDIFDACSYAGIPFTCCHRFQQIRTEFGDCYAFNLAGDVTLSKFTGPSQLRFTARETIMVRMHESSEVISGSTENFLGGRAVLPFVTDLEVYLKVEERVTESGACLGNEDSPGGRGICETKARADMQIKFCNCTHHLMPPIDGVESCNISGIRCLTEIRDLMWGTKSTVGKNCIWGSCHEILYAPYHIRYRQYTGRIEPEILARGTSAMVFISQLPSLRLITRRIRDPLTLAVEVGGLWGVFLGASALSVIEIIYICCLRRIH